MTLSLRRDPRQMNGTPERLLHQFDAIDENAQAVQPAGPKSREMGDPQVDRLAGVQHRQRIAHHGRCRIHAQHDRLAVEAVDPEIVRDLPDHLEHGGLAAAHAEKWKHLDRAVDRPIDVLVDQGFEVFKLAFVDGAVYRARKTPEAVLCHAICFLNRIYWTANGGEWASLATPRPDAALDI